MRIYLTEATISPRIHLASVGQDERVKVATRDLRRLEVGLLDLLGYQLLVLVSVAELAVRAIAPREDLSHVRDGNRVPRSTRDAGHTHARQPRKFLWAGDHILVAQAELALLVAAPCE